MMVFPSCPDRPFAVPTYGIDERDTKQLKKHLLSDPIARGGTVYHEILQYACVRKVCICCLLMASQCAEKALLSPLPT